VGEGQVATGYPVPPNMRVQRARSSASPLRSPLTRHPPGGTGERVGGLVVLTLVIGALGCPPYGDAWIHFGGTVRSTTGDAIPGARVEIHVDGKPPRPDEVGVANDSGHFSFFASSCPCEFQAEVVAVAPGYARFRKSLSGKEANRLETLEITLAPLRTAQ